MLRVSDTGHGMDDQTLARIFDPFFTTKGERGGTGLGLATVNAFAKDTGGQVEVASTLGKGTTFTLWLPEHTGVTAASPAGDLPSPASPRAAHRTRILVVEDRGDVRSNMVRTLTTHGFVVEEAEDGAGAIAMLERKADYTLMCIDGIMPGLAHGRRAGAIGRAGAIDGCARLLGLPARGSAAPWRRGGPLRLPGQAVHGRAAAGLCR